MSPQKAQLRAIFLGGVVPVVAFTAIDSLYGVVWGLVAGMVFGLFEILWEWKTQGKVDSITWIANGMILVLGGVSLFTEEGIWFKLQPAILEAAFALFLLGSLFTGKPLVSAMMEKQLRAQGMELHPERGPILMRAFKGMTLRFGIFMMAHAILATWAAIHWSTAAWATLKGVGFTASMIVYVAGEGYYLRGHIKNISQAPEKTG